MGTDTNDSGITIAAIGLLAYASADVAHHVLGHGGACLALGGSIISLSSVFVDCSLHGATIDLAGPVANLALGLAAMSVARVARPGSAAMRLFWVLAVAFNLFWFAGQLVFSVVTGTDDWAWAMERYGVTAAGRFGLLVIGVSAYLLVIRYTSSRLTGFAYPRQRVGRIVLFALVAAGLTACATATLARDPVRVILSQALPQSVLLPIGLLFVPGRAARLLECDNQAAAVAFSIGWVCVAGIVGIASIFFLGPGIAVAS